MSYGKLVIMPLLAVLVIAFFVVRYITRCNVSGNEKGTIIILNGPSGSGKSTIQRGIQEKFAGLYLKIGIDNFFDMILPDIDEQGQSIEKSSGELIRKIETSQDADGNNVIALKVGPVGQRVIQGMHRALAAYAAQGNNIAMDYIVYDQSWIPDLVQVLKDYKVYLVGVHIPLEILEEREKKRATSPVGHARSHYHTVHKNMIYDFELDTGASSPEECVKKIREFVQANQAPQALGNMVKKYCK